MYINLLSYRTDFNLYGEEVNMVLFWHTKGACALMLIFAIGISWATKTCFN
jgi:hypothetical protein